MFYTDPKIEKVHLVVLYRNFKAISTKYSHIGLGVNGIHTNKVLRKQSIRADVHGVKDYPDIKGILDKNITCTHCLVEAMWISTSNMQQLLRDYPHIHFIVRNHSQIGFLQVEPGALKLINEYMELQDCEANFSYSSNNKRYCEFFEQVHNSPCLYLPNLYDLDRTTPNQHKSHDHKLLRISCFGALRLLKNHTTAAAAAQMIAKHKNCDLEFYLSVNREEHGKSVLESIKHMFSKLKYAKLIENSWESWSDFRRTVANMDLCLQPSFTETFNITSADACADHVPVVGTNSIEWLPDRWQADMDDAADIAEVGMNLLSNPRSGQIGFDALKQYCDTAKQIWLNYLSSNPVT